MSNLPGVAGLEMVRFQEHRDSVTVQVAFEGRLAVPLTVGREAFWSWPSDADRHEWLMRSARTLLDLYGDARDSQVLSDGEVTQRAAA
jgi:hypothetical protein